MGRLRTCQPSICKMRCTVFLLNPISQATVRSPKGRSSSDQAICQRAPFEADGLIHHNDRGSQYLSIKYI